MLIIFAHFYSLENFIKFGILAATSFSIFLFYAMGSLCSAFLYLHLICYSSYLKFKTINKDIKQLVSLMTKREKSKLRGNLVKSIIKRHNEACSSLVEFNKFWRLVIFVIYLSYQPMFCMMLLQSLVIKPDNIAKFIIKMSLAFGALCSIFIILVFSLSTEMVSTEAFSIHPKLSTLILISTRKLNVKTKMKLQNMMIRVSSGKIGFTSFDLFVVDRKAVYEVCLL
jgi:hypothetical protein